MPPPPLTVAANSFSSSKLEIMGGEIVGNLLFQPRVNIRVIVAVCDHTTSTVERDIRHTTPLGVTEATRPMREPAEHVG